VPATERVDLFVGDVDAGMSIAGLYTLVSTCEAGSTPSLISPTSSCECRTIRSAASTNCSPGRGRALVPMPNPRADRTVTSWWKLVTRLPHRVRRGVARSSSQPSIGDTAMIR